MAPAAARLNAFFARDLKGTILPFNFPIDLREVEQLSGRILLKLADRSLHGSMMLTVTAVRMKKPYDWAGFIKAEVPGAREALYHGVPYDEIDVNLPAAKWVPGPWWAYPADERTVVLERGPHVQRLMERRTRPLPRPAWADDWKEVEGGVLAVVLADPKHTLAAHFSRALDAPDLDREARAELEVLGPFARAASRVVVGAAPGPDCRLSARFTCDSAADAEDLEKRCAALIGMARAAAAGLRVPAAGAPAAEKAATRLVRDLAASVTVKRTGTQVVVTAHSRQRLEEALPGLSGVGGPDLLAP
jgi:hypothetical protein